MHMVISIHALREEGDFFGFARRLNLNVISIHALREEGDTDSPKSKPAQL